MKVFQNQLLGEITVSQGSLRWVSRTWGQTQRELIGWEEKGALSPVVVPVTQMALWWEGDVQAPVHI